MKHPLSIFLALSLLLILSLSTACSRTGKGGSTDGESVVPESVAPLDSEKTVEPDSAAMAAATRPGKAAGKPTVLEFSATWCGPCARQKPIYEAAIERFGNRIDMRSIDVDENPELADRYHINAIPAFVFIDGHGKVVGTANFLDANELDARLNSLPNEAGA